MPLILEVWQLVRFNSLWPSDTIWQQRSGSTLAQVMAWCRQAMLTCWTNVDWSSVKSSEIHIMAISQEMPQPSSTKIRLKITCLKFHSNFSGGQWVNTKVTQSSPSRVSYKVSIVSICEKIDQVVTEVPCFNNLPFLDSIKTLNLTFSYQALHHWCPCRFPADYWSSHMQRRPHHPPENEDGNICRFNTYSSELLKTITHHHKWYMPLQSCQWKRDINLCNSSKNTDFEMSFCRHIKKLSRPSE